MSYKYKFDTEVFGKKLLHFEELPSTNTYLYDNAEKYDEGTVVVADSQSEGKGRLNRKWYSTKDKMAQFSILLCPDIPVSNIPSIVHVAALSVLKALTRITEPVFTIKHPNDIYIEHRKCCGILCEMKKNRIKKYVIVGIGINVNQNEKDFVSEIKGKATSLRIAFNKEYSVVSVIENVVERFEYFYYRFVEKGFCVLKDEIIKNSKVIGKKINIKKDNVTANYKAVGYDDEGFLLIQNASGNIERFMTGDIIDIDW